MARALGLIAGNGRLPALVAQAASERGDTVYTVAHVGETETGLEQWSASVDWVHVGQLGAIARHLNRRGVTCAVMVGGIARVQSLLRARPDFGFFSMARNLSSLRDDSLLRGVAGYLKRHGIELLSVTELLPQLLAQKGHLAGPLLTSAQERDVALGFEVAAQLGSADVGQTVVVHRGVVLAVEAIEGTDACIRRAGQVGGKGACVVKRCKPQQDRRFDLPAVGPQTLEVMREAGAQVLAVEAGSTLLLDAASIEKWARRLQISVVAR